jgi:hypothetical protein
MSFRMILRSIVLTATCLVGLQVGPVNALEPRHIMLTGVQVNKVMVCSFGCEGVIPYIEFSLADTPPELCADTSEYRVALVTDGPEGWQPVEQAKLFLSMLIMSKLNKQPLQMWLTVYSPATPATMPQVARYCDVTVSHMGLDE